MEFGLGSKVKPTAPTGAVCLMHSLFMSNKRQHSLFSADPWHLEWCCTLGVTTCECQGLAFRSCTEAGEKRSSSMQPKQSRLRPSTHPLFVQTQFPKIALGTIHKWCVLNFHIFLPPPPLVHTVNSHAFQGLVHFGLGLDTLMAPILGLNWMSSLWFGYWLESVVI